MSAQAKVLNASAVMAAGTLFSRISGFLRSALLVAALGEALHGEIFTIANTLPNSIYILVAGGVFNAVLVPQLVRAMKDDDDGGEAYTNRIITLAALFLGAVTLVLTLAAPLLLRLYLSSEWFDAQHTAQLESLIDLTRWCLPQVFFYGMYVLIGQVLNAREVFGPMMWAPIANNFISILMLIGYLGFFGTVTTAELNAGYGTGQELVLGLGSTLGIAAQFLILVPYLRRAGFSYAPRFDFRGTGLSHTGKLAYWTLLFVIVNQIALFVVIKLASSGPARADDGTGYTVYQASMLIAMVPHSILTVSLATAVIPTLSALAHEGRLREVGSELASVARTALAPILTFAVIIQVVAPDLAEFIMGWRESSRPWLYVPSLRLFALGIVFFTLHYLMLRGFYALEDTRTVFYIQCVIASLNIVVAISLVQAVSPQFVTPALITAYAIAYGIGSAISMRLLNRRLEGGLEVGRLGRFLIRLAPALLATAAVTWGASLLMGWLLPVGAAYGPGPATLAGARVAVAGVAGLITMLAMASVLRITELTDVVATVTRPLRR